MGQAFSLLKAHQNRRLIHVENDDPEADIDVVATLDESGNEALISIINRSPDESHTVELSVAGSNAASSSNCKLLSATNYLPKSVFSETSLTVDPGAGSTMAVTLPQHSIALIRAAL